MWDSACFPADNLTDNPTSRTQRGLANAIATGPKRPQAAQAAVAGEVFLEVLGVEKRRAGAAVRGAPHESLTRHEHPQ